MFQTSYPAQAWHREYDTCEYQRHDSAKQAYVINRSYEGGLFLRYIVDHYHTLPDVVVFVQDDTDQSTLDIIRCLRRDVDWGWTPLSNFYVPERSVGMWAAFGFADAVHACWHALAGDFGLPISNHSWPVVSFYCCANVAVTSTQIRRNSYASYVAAYERLVLSPQCTTDPVWDGRQITNPGNDKVCGAGAFEHLQHFFLGGQPLLMAALTQADWCARLDPADTCPTVIAPLCPPVPERNASSP